MRKREYSHRHIQILALQRCSRAISLVLQNDLYVPDGIGYGMDYPYRTELDLACSEIAYQLRHRLAIMAGREWPNIDQHIFEDSDKVNVPRN